MGTSNLITKIYAKVNFNLIKKLRMFIKMFGMYGKFLKLYRVRLQSKSHS
jgi:hypothetical protein